MTDKGTVSTSPESEMLCSAPQYAALEAPSLLPQHWAAQNILTDTRLPHAIQMRESLPECQILQFCILFNP